MTTLFIAGSKGTPERNTAVGQLLRAGYHLTPLIEEADGIVTLPTMPAKTVRAWLTQASNDARMAAIGRGK